MFYLEKNNDKNNEKISSKKKKVKINLRNHKYEYLLFITKWTTSKCYMATPNYN